MRRVRVVRYRVKRIDAAGDHMRELARTQGVRKASLSTEERRERLLKAVRRVEQDLNPTEPERARFPLRARLGADEGYPVEVLDSFARDFVDELQRGQRGVYARLGKLGVSDGRPRVPG